MKDTLGHGSNASNMERAVAASAAANAWEAARALAQGHPKSGSAGAPGGRATPPSKSSVGGSQHDWETGDHHFPGLP